MQSSVENPHTWAYRKLVTGRQVNIYVYDQKVRAYHEMQRLQFIEQMMQRHDEIAIASSLLTRRQREKYRQHRARYGKNVFYIFDGQLIPADIGGRVSINRFDRVYTQ